MTHYRNGQTFEYKVADYLETQGYVVIRAGGSKGIADLIALKPGQLLLVQVKGGKTQITGEDWNKLFRLARWAGAVPVVADRPKRGVIQLRQVVDVHEPHSRHWPSVPFVVDEVAAS